jgi:hypothetical protein
MIAITALGGAAEPVARFIGRKLGATVEPVSPRSVSTKLGEGEWDIAIGRRASPTDKAESMRCNAHARSAGRPCRPLVSVPGTRYRFHGTRAGPPIGSQSDALRGYEKTRAGSMQTSCCIFGVIRRRGEPMQVYDGLRRPLLLVAPIFTGLCITWLPGCWTR